MSKKGMGKCQRCGEQAVLHKTSARIMPPNGGKVCGNCVGPAALDALKNKTTDLQT